jgi:hypothetical protein
MVSGRSFKHRERRGQTAMSSYSAAGAAVMEDAFKNPNSNRSKSKEIPRLKHQSWNGREAVIP